MKKDPCSLLRFSAQSGPRVLIRAPNWIGDVVMSLPALGELRRLLPRTSLSVLARPWVAPVLEGLRLVDEIIPYPEEWITNNMGPRLKLCALMPMARKLRARDFQCALLFQNAFEAALLSRLAGIPAVAGYSTQGRGLLLTHAAHQRIRPPSRLRAVALSSAVRARMGKALARGLSGGPTRRHQSYLYLDLLFQLGISSTDYLNTADSVPRPRLRITDEATRQAGEMLARHEILPGDSFIVINPGNAGRPARNWPTELHATVADQLAELLGSRIVILGWGPDQALALQVQGQMRSTAVVLSGPPQLPRTLAILHRSQLLITADSGPMHMAAGLGLRQVALFGATDPLITGPLSDSAQTLYQPAPCSPCYFQRCPADMRCWHSITVADAVSAALRALAAKRTHP